MSYRPITTPSGHRQIFSQLGFHGQRHLFLIPFGHHTIGVPDGEVRVENADATIGNQEKIKQAGCNGAYGSD
jgi:hypothetical protein